MHGLIYTGLKEFVGARYGISAWSAVLEKAGLAGKVYSKDEIYPDSDAGAIVKAASELTSVAPNEIMENFGSFLAPLLIMLYRHLINQEWKTMDMLLNMESNIHSVVRKEIPPESFK